MDFFGIFKSPTEPVRRCKLHWGSCGAKSYKHALEPSPGSCAIAGSVIFYRNILVLKFHIDTFD